MICRSLDEAFAAGQATAATEPPISQETADLVEVTLAPFRQQDEAA